MINNSKLIKLKKAKRKKSEIDNKIKQLTKNGSIRLLPKDKILTKRKGKQTRIDKLNSLLLQKFDNEITLHNSKNNYIEKIKEQYINNKLLVLADYNKKFDEIRLMLSHNQSGAYGYSFKNYLKWSNAHRIISFTPREFHNMYKKEKEKLKIKDDYPDDISISVKHKNVKYYTYFSFNYINQILTDTKEKLKKVEVIIKNDDQYSLKEEFEYNVTDVTTNIVSSILKLRFQSFVFLLSWKLN